MKRIERENAETLHFITTPIRWLVTSLKIVFMLVVLITLVLVNQVGWIVDLGDSQPTRPGRPAESSGGPARPQSRRPVVSLRFRLPPRPGLPCAFSDGRVSGRATRMSGNCSGEGKVQRSASCMIPVHAAQNVQRGLRIRQELQIQLPCSLIENLQQGRVTLCAEALPVVVRVAATPPAARNPELLLRQRS
jgi:hypothetical protein